MKNSLKIIKVTELEHLDDKNLVPELKKRLENGQLAFISDEVCRGDIDSLDFIHQGLTGDSVEPLWQPLVENAIAFLKMSDSREWKKDYGIPVVGEEKRSSLEAFGADKLKSYFVQFREFERVLYGAVQHYHDHTLHVFRVWMLGALLLDDWFTEGKYPYIEFFDDLLKSKIKRGTSSLMQPEEIQAMWCVIALSHDLGYPLQKVEDINDVTRAMLRQYAKVNLQDLNFDVPQQHQFINDFILRFISSRTVIPSKIDIDSLRNIVSGNEGKLKDEQKRIFRSHVQAKYYLKYSKSLEDFEHGIFSSILLMKSLTYFLESDFDMDDLKPLEYKDARQCTIRREILRAIADHTCEQIYHIRPHTLSFLLILCDELQSWGRPTIEEIMQGDRSDLPLSKLKSFGEQEVEFELDFSGSLKEVYDRTKKLFRRFHKVLRAAVDAPERLLTCCITVRNKSKPIKATFTFRFESRKETPPEFHFSINNEMWRLWEDTSDQYWKDKLKNLETVDNKPDVA